MIAIDRASSKTRLVTDPVDGPAVAAVAAYLEVDQPRPVDVGPPPFEAGDFVRDELNDREGVVRLLHRPTSRRPSWTVLVRFSNGTVVDVYASSLRKAT